MPLSLANIPGLLRKQSQDDPNVQTPGALPYSGPNLNSQATADPFSALTPGVVGSTRTVAPGSVQAAPEIKQFAFNPKYAAMDQALLRRIASAGQQRDITKTSAQQEFGYAQDEAGRQRQQAFDDLAGKLAANGLYNSGIRAQGEGKLTESYTRYLDALQRKLAGAQTGAEFDYSNTIADVAAQREGLWGQQVQEEEAMRLAEAQRRAEAEAAQRQADAQRQMMEQLIAAQQAAQAAYQPPPSYGVGGYGVSTPEPAAQPGPQGEQIYGLPPGYFQTPGATRQGVENYVVNNIDSNLRGDRRALDAVVNALSQNPGGMTLEQIQAIINSTRMGSAASRAIKRFF